MILLILSSFVLCMVLIYFMLCVDHICAICPTKYQSIKSIMQILDDLTNFSNARALVRS